MHYLAEIYFEMVHFSTAWFETERGQLDHQAAGSLCCLVALADNLEDLEVETGMLVVVEEPVQDLRK